MNQRLKEIMLAHGLHKNISEDCQHRMEMLAELIIQECVGVVEGGHFLHEDAPDARFARECSSAIKRYFGVES